jgi:cold shock CspA family protein
MGDQGYQRQERQTGVVKFYDPSKGFGFITFNAKGEDAEVFVHQVVENTQLSNSSLRSGDHAHVFLTRPSTQLARSTELLLPILLGR